MSLKTILVEIRTLEEAVAGELNRTEKSVLYRIKHGKIEFDKDVVARHRKARMGIVTYLFNSSFLTVLSAPFIYSLIFPALFLDVMVRMYQSVCFPVYEIAKVNRADYVLLDRNKLKYLNVVERINCSFCSYFNGVIAFVREVGSRTEQYWCPIRHALRTKGTHARYKTFLPYGDEKNYQAKLMSIRKSLSEVTPASDVKADS